MSATKTAPKDRIAEMAERFARETAEHEMTIVKDDGLYRHIRFRRPQGKSPWFCWFDLVTWPGNLVIRGDCGTYTFTRVDDMFAFFRLDGGSINPGYWSEKTPDAGRSCRTYSVDLLRELLSEWLADYEDEYPEADADYEQRLEAWLEEARDNAFVPMPEEPDRPTPTKVRMVIKEYEDYNGLNHTENARELLDELERLDALSDSWEWDLTDWDWQFLWCCHAIVWGITQYDTAKARRPDSRWARLRNALIWRRP